MSTFTEALKNTTKMEWMICFGGIVFFFFLYHFSTLPRLIINPFLYGFAAGLFVYSAFFKKNLGIIKHRLYNAMIGGAFIYLFLESICSLFAKLAAYRYF